MRRWEHDDRMSMAARDREAFDLVSRRSFGGAFVASLEIEMQTRRLTLVLYGPLRPGDRTTYLGTVTFFGASAVALENNPKNFPESVGVSSFALSYDDDADIGRAELSGAQAWTRGWSFDGLAYEERAALVASLADDNDEA
jgi:hypothetical protein